MTVVDLFSGAGGMSAGFHTHPDLFRIVGAADIEVGKPGLGKSPGTVTYCNRTYATNIGVEPLNVDLASVQPSDLRQAFGLVRGELDVLIACPPCTGFSQKNANNHVVDDPRNHLVERVGLFVREFLPEFIVMENVKELLTGNQRHHFQSLRTSLEELDYRLWTDVHDLSHYGLAQRRIRALILGRRNGFVAPFPRSMRRFSTARAAIGHLPPVAAGEQHPDDDMHVSPRVGERVLARMQAIPRDGGSWSDVMNSRRFSIAEKEYLLIPAMFRARPGSFPDVYGRLWWDRPAPTITRECAHVGNGRYTHPEQDRLLTVREMSLLQGFPADYRFEGPLRARYNQIGDAVPPMMAELIALLIAAIRTGTIDERSQLRPSQEQLALLQA